MTYMPNIIGIHSKQVKLSSGHQTLMSEHPGSLRKAKKNREKYKYWNSAKPRTYIMFPPELSKHTKFEGSNWTRQNSTQSLRNMPPLPPRHLLPHVLQIRPRNPKNDQLQSKGHHNEEYPQSMTKIPKFDPFHEVKMVLKLEKSTNCDHNLLSSGDTSACKMPGHSLHVFLEKWPKTPNLDRFTKSK